jgi:hypothetical protein
MKSLVDLIYFIDWSLAFILHSLILICKISLLDCSFTTKSSPEFTKLLISMISNCDQSVVIVKHYSEPIYKSKIAIGLKARKSSNDIVMIRKIAGKFD